MPGLALGPCQWKVADVCTWLKASMLGVHACTNLGAPWQTVMHWQARARLPLRNAACLLLCDTPPSPVVLQEDLEMPDSVVEMFRENAVAGPGERCDADQQLTCPGGERCQAAVPGSTILVSPRLAARASQGAHHPPLNLPNRASNGLTLSSPGRRPD